MPEVMTMEYAQKRLAELKNALGNKAPSPLALGELAACYFTLNDPDTALPLAKLGSELRKDSATLMNLGLIYKDLGRHKESFRAIEEAYWLNPNDPYIRLGYGEALLRAGFWKQAWPVYDNTRPTQQAARAHLSLPDNILEWNGEELPKGHLVMIINEGGTGDRFSYARWLPELTKRGINWKFYPYSELFSFFERIMPREKLIADGDEIVATHWTTTFALPAKLNVGPNEIPEPLLFKALPEKIQAYQFKKSGNFPVLGLCYQAAELFQGGRRVRSLTEGQAMRLVCQTGDKVHWVSLQHGVKVPYPVTNLAFESWEDTAGILANLDGLVTVDTGVMHLAGGMRKNMAVILSGNSCWKFGEHGRYHKLYPTAKFYRNQGHGVENAISSLIEDILSGSMFPSL